MDANYTFERGKIIERTKATCALFIAAAEDQGTFELVRTMTNDHSWLSGDVISGD
jgi:hypothetical protein